MNRLLGVALGLLAALLIPLSASAQLTQVPLGTSAAPYGYYEYLPFGYDDATTEEWPVVIFLHGIGEVGNGTTQLADVLNTGLPQNIKNGTHYPFVAIMPQSTVTGWSVSHLDAMVQFVKANYHVNADRIYLTGLSMGGIGTWNYASDHYQEVAAIWPLCGAPAGTPRGGNLVNVPTWAFHGWGDTVARTSDTVRWIDSIAMALGATRSVTDGYTPDRDKTASFINGPDTWSWLDGVAQAAGSHPTLTLYASANHNCWTKTYDNATPMKWLLAQNRFGAANKAPSAAITTPTHNATFTNPPSVTINAQITDSDGTISRVEFYAGTQLLGTDNSSPHQFVWSNPPAGPHWITVKAIDDDNAVSAALVKITVIIIDDDLLCQQSFDGSTSVTPAPCFDDISAEVDGGAWSIQGGRLQLIREGSGTTDNDAGMTRWTDFSGPPSLLHVTFDLGASNWTVSPWQTGAIWLAVAKISGFVDYGASEPAVNIFSGLSVNGKGGGKYVVSTAGVDSALLNADGTMYKVALFLNKSGAAASYRAPDNTVRSLRANGVALWVNSSPVVVDAAASNGSSSALTDLRLRWTNSENATWQLDNWVIRNSFPQ